jgi:hypothetical protein
MHQHEISEEIEVKMPGPKQSPIIPKLFIKVDEHKIEV